MAQFSSTRGETTLINSPRDMAELLLGANAVGAAAYALAAHDVCLDLATIREQLDHEPLRRVA